MTVSTLLPLVLCETHYFGRDWLFLGERFIHIQFWCDKIRHAKVRQNKLKWIQC